MQPFHLEAAISRLQEAGFHPTVDEQAFEVATPGYFAGTVAARASSVNQALANPDIRAILATRGGYGSMQIIEHIDWDLYRRDPKPIIGFSDITALHMHMQSLGHTSFLGPVAKSFELHRRDLDQLVDTLTGHRETPYTIQGKPVHKGLETGVLVGGNLSLIVHMLGSSSCPPLHGKILVLEDVNEPDYRIDRLFAALELSEKSRGISGVALGSFLGCDGVYVPPGKLAGFIEQLGSRLAQKLNCPVICDIPVGHSDRHLTLPLGTLAEINGEAGTLILLEDGVVKGHPS